MLDVNQKRYKREKYVKYDIYEQTFVALDQREDFDAKNMYLNKHDRDKKYSYSA